MSDIAMMVAEEYERRVSIMRKGKINLDLNVDVHGVSLERKRIVESEKKLLMKPKTDSLKWAWEPKSQLGVAASANFFSA